MKNKSRTCTLLMLALFCIALTADLLTKYLIANGPEGESAAFLPGFLRFYTVHNHGAAWSMFAGVPILLIVITFLFLFVFLYYFFTKREKSVLFSIASGLVIGGTIGNLFDRLVLGYVRDFLHFEFVNFPTFNVADTFICIGVALLAIYFLFFYTKQAQKERETLNAAGLYQEDNIKISTADLDAPETRKFSIKEITRLLEKSENEQNLSKNPSKTQKNTKKTLKNAPKATKEQSKRGEND